MGEVASGTRPRRSRFPLYLQICAGMALGLLLGPLLGSQASGLGELGRLVIQLIKAAATPLLFLSIVNAILKTEIRGRAAVRLLFWATFNASIALAIGLGISNLFQPGRSLAGHRCPPVRRRWPPTRTRRSTFLGSAERLLPLEPGHALRREPGAVDRADRGAHRVRACAGRAASRPPPACRRSAPSRTASRPAAGDGGRARLGDPADPVRRVRRGGQGRRRARLRAAEGAGRLRRRSAWAACCCTSLVTYHAWLLLFARMPCGRSGARPRSR